MATGSIAWKNLTRERTRLVISVGGVAFAVLLILLLRGLYAGFLTQATAYVRGVDTDVWVAKADTPGDFFHSVSLQQPSFGERIAGVEGVSGVTPFVGRPVVFKRDGEDLNFYLVGVDSSNPVAAPPAAVEGSRVPGPGEIVIDRVFARNNGIGIGDTLRITGTDLRVSGIARGGNSVITQFAFANLPDVIQLFGQGGFVNYFLVQTVEGADPSRMTAAIRDAVPETKPMTTAEFSAANTKDLEEGFLPIIWVLMLIGFVIGTLVIGLTIYTATLEKRREYGVLKAIGLSNRSLYGIVWRQSLASAVLGLIVGVAVTLVLGKVLEQMLPMFVTTFRLRDIALVSAVAVAMAVAASFVPVRPVARLDPAQVFRI
ncbi:FtsX-like permease family protein [Nocardia farcinica]|uniref:ABC transporter permease n=1 Tax=Nocardia farcinica TaxID=37329 RepID=UPI00189476BA|nr:FtsX-like permease family protein [Nocardia farcinica]MBF6422827.1 FtsX-like permease family protein [Nocardia farcinica]MBF6434546.1 FtsX-like permease family protein [Nocardia farcinica]MBF6505646.1 FtsX-like permease family protein [Nocardia farcinica]